MRERTVACAAGLFIGLISGGSWLASATEPPGTPAIATERKSGARYQDVREDLLMAIEARGFVVGAIGDLGMMLSRSGPDLGRKPVYLHAEYLNFCPTAIAHALAAAEPSDVAYCPFQMVIYETVAAPGTIVVGYRHPGAAGSAVTRAILADAERVFASIAKAAVK
jgi:uncharacterized protein (DUF302 family)